MWPFSSNDSKSSSDSQHGDAKSGISLTEEQRMRIFGGPNPISTPSTTSNETREQQSDAELDAFINSFSASETPNPQTTSQTTTQTPQPSPPPTRLNPDGTLNISPEVMYPRTMSCRQHFDQAFYCQSLGGKFNDIYRYGHIKSCSEQWGAFWFCMRTNNLVGKEREEKIAEFYREREERRKAEFGSSEDVWEVRRVAVKRAFWRDPDEEGSEGMVKE